MTPPIAPFFFAASVPAPYTPYTRRARRRCLASAFSILSAARPLRLPGQLVLRCSTLRRSCSPLSPSSIFPFFPFVSASCNVWRAQASFLLTEGVRRLRHSRSEPHLLRALACSLKFPFFLLPFFFFPPHIRLSFLPAGLLFFFFARVPRRCIDCTRSDGALWRADDICVDDQKGSMVRLCSSASFSSAGPCTRSHARFRGAAFQRTAHLPPSKEARARGGKEKRRPEGNA